MSDRFAIHNERVGDAASYAVTDRASGRILSSVDAGVAAKLLLEYWQANAVAAALNALVDELTGDYAQSDGLEHPACRGSAFERLTSVERVNEALVTSLERVRETVREGLLDHAHRIDALERRVERAAFAFSGDVAGKLSSK